MTASSWYSSINANLRVQIFLVCAVLLLPNPRSNKNGGGQGSENPCPPPFNVLVGLSPLLAARSTANAQCLEVGLESNQLQCLA
jgi:hypothetical protein